jgi:hypothetical protein
MAHKGLNLHVAAQEILNNLFMKYQRLLVIICLIFSASKIHAQDDRVFKTFPPKNSLLKSIGKEEQIAGKIFGGEHSLGTTRLYFGDPFPNQIVILIISDKDRKKFLQAPEILYANKDVKVKGSIDLDDGKLVIKVTDPIQISTVVRRVVNYRE